MKIKAQEFKGLKRKDFENQEDYQKAVEDHQKYNISPEGLKSIFTLDGKLRQGISDRLTFSLKEMYNPVPKTAVNLGSGSGQEELDKMVDEIIEKDKLMSLSPSELGEKMKNMHYDGEGLIEKGKLAADSIRAKENAPAPNENGLKRNAETDSRQIGLS